MFGTFVNTLAIILGSLAGLVVKGGIPKTYMDTVMQAIGLAVILIGLKGALGAEDLLLVIFSLAIGGVAGEFLRIEERLEHLGLWLERKLSRVGATSPRGL